ncbi:Retrovirus-related Pol polyprotein from transposon opus [Dictyocoela muelleri]|nr:Retrovirus-related Pol polyprotein from transposon opus [Dictyocoela muelleri]
MGQKYKFNRMSFGLKNAPYFFHRMITEILSDLSFIEIFIDDILIFSQTEQEHMKHINQTLYKLAKYNIKINLNKCKFLQTSVKYLGQIIDCKGIKPDTSRIKHFKFSKPNKKMEFNENYMYNPMV